MEIDVLGSMVGDVLKNCFNKYHEEVMTRVKQLLIDALESQTQEETNEEAPKQEEETKVKENGGGQEKTDSKEKGRDKEDKGKKGVKEVAQSNGAKVVATKLTEQKEVERTLAKSDTSVSIRDLIDMDDELVYDSESGEGEEEEEEGEEEEGEEEQPAPREEKNRSREEERRSRDSMTRSRSRSRERMRRGRSRSVDRGERKRQRSRTRSRSRSRSRSRERRDYNNHTHPHRRIVIQYPHRGTTNYIPVGSRGENRGGGATGYRHVKYNTHYQRGRGYRGRGGYQN